MRVHSTHTSGMASSGGAAILETASKYIAGGSTTRQPALAVWRSTLRTAIEDDGASRL